MIAAPIQHPTIRNKLHHGAPVEARPGLVVAMAWPFCFAFRRNRRHRVRIVVRGATTTQVAVAAPHRVLAVRVAVGVVRREQGGRG